MTRSNRFTPPPTPEEWQSLPLALKLRIVIIIFVNTWQSSLAYWWLKGQGIYAQVR